MGVKLVAAAWGLAEATLFFLVPDIWISLVTARRGLRPGLIACLFATAGALVGGAAMFGWARFDAATAISALDRVPAISSAMIERVESQLTHDGTVALFAGAFTGTPYKIYAVLSASAGISLPHLLLVTVPARLSRFVLVALTVNVLSTTAFKNRSPAQKTWAAIAFWIVFYSVFLSLMPG